MRGTPRIVLPPTNRNPVDSHAQSPPRPAGPRAQSKWLASIGALALSAVGVLGAGCSDDQPAPVLDAASPDSAVLPDAAPIPDAAPVADAAPMPDAAPVVPVPCNPAPGGPQNPAAPAVELAFPPPRSLTDNALMHVRGRATHTETIASITVNGAPATTTNDFADWSATVPLGDGENAVVIESADSSGNIDPTAAEVCVVLSRTIPERMEFIEVDAAGDRALILDRELEVVLAMDLTTGIRTELSGPSVGTGVSLGRYPDALAYDPSNDRAYVMADDVLLSVDLATGDRSAVTPSENDLRTVGNLAFDGVNNRVLATAVFDDRVVAVDPSTGQISELSGAAMSGPPLDFPRDIVIDADNNRALVGNHNPFELIGVDLSTGERTLLSGSGVGSGPSVSGTTPSLTMDSAGGRVFAATQAGQVVYAIDLATGDRTVVSNSSTGAGSLPRSILGLAHDPDGARLLAVDRIVDVVWAIDIATGDRSFASHASFGTGTPLDRPGNVTFDDATDTAYFIDASSSRIVGLDLATGARSTIWSGSMGSLFSMVMDAGEDRILMLNYSTQAIVAFQPATATFTTLASSSVGSGPSLETTRAITADEVGGGVFLMPSDCSGGSCIGRVLSVDTTTGNRFVVSSNSMGNGPSLLGSRSIAHDSARNRALVLDRPDVKGCAPESCELRVVDLATGDRSTLAGVGPGIENGVAIALDPARDELYILWAPSCQSVNFVGNSGLTRVDLATGERSILSGDGVGLGPDLVMGAEMVLDADGDLAIVADWERPAIVAVDLITGYRVILAR